MRTFCALITTPKLPFRLNDKACETSSWHEDVSHALTFGWFGDAFFVMNVQNLAILAGIRSSFSKSGI